MGRTSFPCACPGLVPSRLWKRHARQTERRVWGEGVECSFHCPLLCTLCLCPSLSGCLVYCWHLNTIQGPAGIGKASCQLLCREGRSLPQRAHHLKAKLHNHGGRRCPLAWLHQMSARVPSWPLEDSWSGHGESIPARDFCACLLKPQPHILEGSQSPTTSLGSSEFGFAVQHLPCMLGMYLGLG